MASASCRAVLGWSLGLINMGAWGHAPGLTAGLCIVLRCGGLHSEIWTRKGTAHHARHDKLSRSTTAPMTTACDTASSPPLSNAYPGSTWHHCPMPLSCDYVVPVSACERGGCFIDGLTSLICQPSSCPPQNGRTVSSPNDQVSSTRYRFTFSSTILRALTPALRL